MPGLEKITRASYDHTMRSCDFCVSGHGQGTGNITNQVSGQRPGWETGRLIIHFGPRGREGSGSAFLISAQPVGIGKFSIHVLSRVGVSCPHSFAPSAKKNCPIGIELDVKLRSNWMQN